MAQIDILRKEVKQYVDNADEKSLRIVKAVLEIEQEEENEEEEDWDDLPKELQIMIDKAIKEGEEGKVTPHAQVVEKYKKWFKK